MEENLEETVQTPLIVSEDMRSYIYDTTKWANFLAIVGFVVAGLMIVTSFTFGAAMSTNPELSTLLSTTALSPIGFTLFCLAYAFAVFYPSLLLFKYSTKAKQGVLYGEQASLDEAFSKIKSLFKYWGIITILGIGLYVLLIIFSVVTNVAR